MRVTVEKLPQSSVALDIVADPDEFNKAMERAFQRVNRQVRIPGFRPGRAPRFIIEQRIGREAIIEEAQREIMDTLYRQALEQEDIVPVSEPSVDIYQDEPVGFRVEVQVYPSVELDDYQAVRVEPREVTVSDEDVDNVLRELQRTHSVWIEPDEPRAPREGDQVTLDLEVTENGEPVQEPLQGGVFVLGESALFPQIEEAVKQLKPGESAEFDITFEEDAENVNPELRGKTLHYKVTLNEVKERELPEIDDDLAATVGDYETIDELRASIRQDLLRSRAAEARMEVINEAVEAIAAVATVEIPLAMVDREVNDQIQRLRDRLAQQGTSLEEYLRFENKTLDEFREEERPNAERRLRNSLVLEAFAKAEGIEVSDDDLMAEIDRLTGPAENPEQMREIYSSPYFRGLIVEELANRKISDRLIEIVTEGRGAVTGEGAEALKAAEAQPEATSTEVIGEVPEDAEAEAEAEAAEAEEASEADQSDEAAAVVAAESAAEDEAAEPESDG